MEGKDKKPHGLRKPHARLEELMRCAELLQIEVRKEKLLREVGYRVLSGSCRLKQKRLIILDRDLSVRDQVELLTSEILRSVPDPSATPAEVKDLLR